MMSQIVLGEASLSLVQENLLSTQPSPFAQSQTAYESNTLRALITGSLGNIGHACVDEAINRGFDIETISREDVDLSDLRATERFVKEIGRFDIILACHGYQRLAKLEKLDSEVIERVLTDNLSTCINLTTALLKNNALKSNSLIVYFSSIQATHPKPGRGLYAAAKAGLEGYARAVASELPYGKRAIALRLGQMTEPMTGIEIPHQVMEDIIQRTRAPLPSPKMIAELCFNLYNTTAITGVVLEISSGHNLSIW